jgi:hypothetical protein
MAYSFADFFLGKENQVIFLKKAQRLIQLLWSGEVGPFKFIDNP